MRTVSQTIEEEGPTVFDLSTLEMVPDLFRERAALFYTPTENLPPQFVGSGILRVTLPIVSPNMFEFYELRGYTTPRLWVDLLQRATGLIRWRPYEYAKVSIKRVDVWSDNYDICGAKALLDSLKRQTHGRADRMPLYYFGAIEDDRPSLLDYGFVNEATAKAADAHMEISVEPQ